MKIDKAGSGDNTLLGMAWSPGREHFLAAASTTLGISLYRIGRFVDNDVLFRNPGSVPASLAWSDDGRRLATGWSDQKLRLFDMEADQRALAGTWLAHESAVTALDWRPKHQVLASGGEDGTVAFWDLESEPEEPLHRLELETEISKLAWSPDGETLAILSDRRALLWRSPLGAPGHVPQELSEEVRDLAWAPDGTILATAEADGRIRLRPAETGGKETVLEAGSEPVAAVTFFHRDSRYLVTQTLGGTLQVWEVAGAKLLCEVATQRPSDQDLSVLLVSHPTLKKVACLENQASISVFSVELKRSTEGGEARLTAKIWRDKGVSVSSRGTAGKGTVAPAKTTTPVKAAEPPAAEAEEEPPSRLVRFLRRFNHNDRWTADDTLGFRNYTQPIADFLTNEATKPPITLSVEGKWGAGKTSFMRQLEGELRARRYAGGEGKDRERIYTVWFEPWRHEEGTSLWAAFALDFMRQMRQQNGPIRRVLSYFGMFRWGFKWREGWYHFLRAGLTLITFLGFIVCSALLFSTQGIAVWQKLEQAVAEGAAAVTVETVDGLSDPGGEAELPVAVQHLLAWGLGLGGWGILSLVFLTIFWKTRGVFSTPVDVSINKYLRSSDYRYRVTFVAKFHRDFKDLVRNLAGAGGQARVFIFIDDLDRCGVPQAADLMQAINLLISDNEQIVFILGMDREKVAAGLAVKYREILPFLAEQPVSKPETEDDPSLRDVGLAYGYQFLEKFIQIPFRLPRASRVQIEEFLDDLTEASDEGQTALDENSKESASAKLGLPEGVVVAAGLVILDDEPSPARPLPAAQSADRQLGSGSAARRLAERSPDLPPVRFTADAPAIRDLTSELAVAFDMNPRRIKQFLNLFRLHAFIAHFCGLLKDEAHPDGAFTYQQLGKFVAVGLVAPQVVSDLEQDPGLLQRLEQEALGIAQGSGDPRVRRWSKNRDLAHVLRCGKFPNIDRIESEYSFDRLPLGPLIEISASPR